MKKILAILLFIFDIIAGPILFVAMSVYLLIRYSLFYKYRHHWYDGIVISKDYVKYMIKNSPTLYRNSYNLMKEKLRA